MSSLRLVIFDCDGTLVDSHHSIGASMESAFTDVGLPYPGAEAVRKVVGLSLHDAALKLLPPEHHALAPELTEGYKRAFSALRLADQVDEPLFPGVRETLDLLRTEDILLGIATGKGMTGLKKTLSGHGLTDHFLTLQTADLHPGKPDPAMLLAAMAETGVEKESTLFVGDTTFDIEMGKRARVETLGVSWGYHAPEALKESGAGAIIETMDEVVHHALRLQGVTRD